MARFRTLDDLDVRDKRVLVRTDLNVPMKDGKVTDATRIERTAGTLKELADRGARVVVLSHLGRPKGVDPALSLRVLVAPLSQALDGRTVAFAEDCIGRAAERVVAALGPGGVALLENLRFHPEEEKNDPVFVAALAALGDLYVNDAFSAAHRAHASTEGLAHRLPAAAGRLMQAELEHLGRALDHPERPLAAIIGGAKVSTKIEVLGHLVAKVDVLAIAGGMANTFLHARGVGIGGSLAEREMADTARAIMDKAAARGVTVVLPVDAVIARTLKPGVEMRTVAIPPGAGAAVPDDMLILDIGPASVDELIRHLRRCRTLVWNGPLGAFETPPFDAGTTATARAVAELTRAGRLLSVAGGGDTVAALARAGELDHLSYVSTAGGAFLEWLEGKTLPGVAALMA
ncbi:MAG: phosphoglycerate kinase [Rhodospirillaceae bacterium]|nr:phosphoglycerate kinase [Rhodospirillaceae bacterium]